MVNVFYALLFLLLFSGNIVSLQAQEYKTFIQELKLGNIEKASQLVEKSSQGKAVKSFLLIYLDYLKTGNYQQQSFPTEEIAKKSFPATYKSMYYYMYGDIIKGEYMDSDFFYPLYLKALDIAEKENNKVLENEALKRLLHHFQRNPLNLKLYESYKNRFLKNAKDSINMLWAKYYDISFKVHKECLRKKVYKKKGTQKDFTTSIDTVVFQNLLNAKVATKQTFFKARVHQMFGICQDVLKEDPKRGKSNFEKAQQYFEESTYHFSKKEVVRATINKGCALKLARAYNEAIIVLKSAVNFKDSIKQLTEKRVVYQQLSDCYDSLRKIDSVNYCIKQKIYVDKLISEYTLAEKIYSLDYDNRIYTIKEEKEKLNKDNQMLFIGGIVLLIILVLVYYNWCVSKKENKNLEVKHEQVIEEIKSIKKLVIQDRIVLKNKVHVLLDELIYIKAEDHYLALHTVNKKEFIRGKISSILKELPPNFVRSHRSYIVNKNHLVKVDNKGIILKENKEIPPPSRTYKNNFI